MLCQVFHCMCHSRSFSPPCIARDSVHYWLSYRCWLITDRTNVLLGSFNCTSVQTFLYAAKHSENCVLMCYMFVLLIRLYWMNVITNLCNTLTRYVNFREFYFSIREFHISRLVEYSKLTRHSAWTTHLMRECCNTVDITPCGCGWAAAPGKWSNGREAVAVSNYKEHSSLSCTRVLSDPTDRLLSSQTHHTLWL